MKIVLIQLTPVLVSSDVQIKRHIQVPRKNMDAPIKTRRPWHSTHKKMRLQKLTHQIKRLNPDIASTEAQMHMKRHQGLQQNSHMRC